MSAFRKYRQIPVKDAGKGLALVAANLKMTPKEIADRLGVVFEQTNDGFDDMEAALLVCENGKQFGLFRYENSPSRNYCALVVREDTHTLALAVNDALDALDLTKEDVISFHPDYWADVPAGNE
jgi:hypothetical protein